MIKHMCVLVLLAASCTALPLEDVPKLTRPSPINPAVISDPKPTEAKEASTTESHVQKIPASGVKLSVEVAKNEQTTTASAVTEETTGKEKTKRSLENESTSASTSTTTGASTTSATTTKLAAFRRNQPTTSTEQPSSTTGASTTHSPVSVKTPVGTARNKRELEVTAATASPTTGLPKRTTTLSPASSAASDDKEGPHYVRPVPVEQILKSLNQPEKHTTEHNNTEKKNESSEQENSSEEKSTETSARESTHPKNHPVIHQQGA